MNCPLPILSSLGRYTVIPMRKRYDKTFKAKVALKALQGERTIQEIA